jgi:hypothetical protein
MFLLLDFVILFLYKFYDVVYTEADIWLRKVHQQPRKILRYDKANWDNIKFDLEDTLKKIININNDAKRTVNEM